MKWMLNSDGKPDFVMTLTFIAFLIVSASILIGLVESFTFFGNTVALRKLEAGEIAAYLGTLFTAYVARRNQIGSGKNNKNPNPPTQE